MRTENSIRNTVVGILGQVFSIIINFISRTVFIHVLGADFLGINGLFTNVLSMLSLAELGIGNAIIFSMYKPLAYNDKNKLNALMNLYKKAYRWIGIIVGVLGLMIMPFLNYIINEPPNIENLNVIYILFLANSVVSYFYVYKSSIIIADQKNYIMTIRQQIYNFIKIVVQIIILITTHNFILYLFIQVIGTFMSNLSISKKADLLYPYLNDKNVPKLDNQSKKSIYKNILAMMTHKVGEVAIGGTDNIIISTFVNVYWVGIYSNYFMIISMLNNFLSQIFTSLTASVGNLNVKESKEKSYDIYKKMFFLNFWLYGFCSICLLVLINPFIQIWIGKDYLMKMNVVFIIITNFYITGMRQTTMIFKNTFGLFWNDRFKPLLEAIVNIVVSIVLIKKLGVIGVFLGTFISIITTAFWIEPYVLFKHGFKKKMLIYFAKYILYLFITLAAGIITEYLSLMIQGNIYISFIVKVLICLIVPNIIFLIVCIRMKEFEYFKILLLKLIKKYHN